VAKTLIFNRNHTIMKKIILNFLMITSVAAILVGCKRDDDYTMGTPSSYISNLDLRKIWQGADVTLTEENMRAAVFVKGVVISDHSEKNLPAGLLILQNARRAGDGIDSLRGISINIGADAAKYVPGDSVHVRIDGGVLSKSTGILTVNGKTGTDVEKKAAGRRVVLADGTISQFLLFPDRYESTQVRVIRATYSPPLASTDVLKGSKLINDGTGDITLRTADDATFASTIAPYSANYRGIILNTVVNGRVVPQLRIRKASDMKMQSAVADPAEIVITGFINDPMGGDTNAEYIQCRATKDINFATTPFSLVTTNNAGSAAPTGVPTNGWATGGVRTYKIEIKTGSVVKGEFFYVGNSTKVINGPGSTPMSSSKFLPGTNYNVASQRFNTTQTNVGNSTTNLLANSGNAFGMAIFRGLVITATTVPIDVVFVHNGGSLYQAGGAPNYGAGYRIANTDLYYTTYPDENDVDVPQPYFLAGQNQKRFLYQPNASSTTGEGEGYFWILGGTFDATVQKKWVAARSQNVIRLTKTSTLAEIENEKSTQIK
jgi:hypothetical protein